MERYETSSKAGGAKYEDWEHVKECSKIFDTAKYVLNICKPDIFLIMNWNTDIDESWLIGNEKIDHLEIESYHWYYKIGMTNIYWLPHPRFTSSNIGFDKSIEIIIKDYKSRKNGI